MKRKIKKLRAKLERIVTLRIKVGGGHCRPLTTMEVVRQYKLVAI